MLAAERERLGSRSRVQGAVHQARCMVVRGFQERSDAGVGGRVRWEGGLMKCDINIKEETVSFEKDPKVILAKDQFPGAWRIDGWWVANSKATLFDALRVVAMNAKKFGLE